MIAPARLHDVVVLGDGPAGLALGAACVHAGLDTVVVGRATPWTATYAAWVDDVPAHIGAFASTMQVDAVGLRRTTLDRAYGVLDNRVLRESLDVAPRVVAEVVAVDHLLHASVVRCAADVGDLAGRLVVDARGVRADVGVPVQTAYGLVLDHRPEVIEGDGGVLMDWRQPVGSTAGPVAARHVAEFDHPTFLYVVDLGGGRWLVEETSLAHRRALPAEVLRARLAVRLGADLTEAAEAVEHVSIPMRPGVPAQHGRVVLFGAAAGYVHPATGYSVAVSLGAAGRVADAVADSMGVHDPNERAAQVRAAVWPSGQARARALHDYGLAALLRLPSGEVQTFFDTFFALPTEQWSAYLRVDTDARSVAGAMSRVFRDSPWPLRRRLAAGSPRPLLDVARRLLRS